MLTDWERRQLAEIERGLAQDFTLRCRARRLVRSIKPWPVTSVLTCICCLVVLLTVGAWHVALALAVVYGAVMLGGRSLHRGREQGSRRPPRPPAR